MPLVGRLPLSDPTWRSLIYPPGIAFPSEARPQPVLPAAGCTAVLTVSIPPKRLAVLLVGLLRKVRPRGCGEVRGAHHRLTVLLAVQNCAVMTQLRVALAGDECSFYQPLKHNEAQIIP